jgi:UDP-N-acetylmuramoylalanine--D-glutamate ligase
MVNSIFDSAGISGVACGNVGETVIEALQFEKPYDFLALELSSFQIDWSREARFVASAVLNIAEDHIDWHGSFDAYANAKMKILEYSEIGILNAEDPEIVTRASAWNGKKIYFSLETPQPGELGLVENILVDRAFIADSTKAEEIAELTDIRPTVPHNVSNALAAAGLARAIGISYEEIKKGISQFKVDHHRIETVLQKDGITWVNDSKATNPHAAIASILSHEKVVWIAGGLAKGASMDELVRRAKPRLSSVILIGTDASLIEKAILENAPEISFHKIENQENSEELMKSIVLYAKKIAKSGETVLLAPACASMDQFISYAHRGNLFADAVRSIVGK